MHCFNCHNQKLDGSPFCAECKKAADEQYVSVLNAAWAGDERLAKTKGLLCPGPKHRYTMKDLMLDNPSAATTVIDYLQSSEAFLVISGPNGVGKTAAAWSALYGWYKLLGDSVPHSALYYKSNDAYQDSRQFKAQELAEPYKYCGLLILDDVANVKMEPAMFQHMYGIIDHRWEFGKRTILLTTQDADGVEKNSESGIATRMYSGVVLELNGKNRRKKVSA